MIPIRPKNGSSYDASVRFNNYFDVKKVAYIGAARFHCVVKRAVGQGRWTQLKDGVEVFETTHAFSQSGDKRRLIIVRKDIGKLPKSTGRQFKILNDQQEDGR